MIERRTAAFSAMGMALPSIVLALTHDLGHDGDIEFFHRWYLAFRESAAFYRDGPGVNYPIVGALVVCLPARLIDLFTGAPLDLPSYRWALKATLALADVLFIVALARLARQLGASSPRTLALALYAVPASWAAGSFFGQIDGVVSLLLVVATSELIAYRRSGSAIDIAGALFATMAALLCKQLAWFSLPALVALLAIGLRAHRRRSHLALALASPLLLFVADPVLALPETFHSHLHFVISAAAHHGDLLVATGASLWSLSNRSGQDAHTVRFFGVSAFAIGWLLFALVQVVAVRRARAAHWTDAALVEWQCVLHFAMSVVLTGVHERYLVHGLAFGLVVLFARPEPRWIRALALLAATWWGLFVMASVEWDAFGGPLSFLRTDTPLALLLVVTLLALLARPLARDVPER